MWKFLWKWYLWFSKKYFPKKRFWKLVNLVQVFKILVVLVTCVGYVLNPEEYPKVVGKLGYGNIFRSFISLSYLEQGRKWAIVQRKSLSSAQTWLKYPLDGDCMHRLLTGTKSQKYLQGLTRKGQLEAPPQKKMETYNNIETQNGFREAL